MAEITVYRMRTQRIDRQRFQQFAEHLEIKGQVVESEEALLVHDERSSLAYAQPGSKFAGLLLFTDKTRSLATIPKHLIAADEAGKWTNEFLGRSGLTLPKIVSKQRPVLFTPRRLCSMAKSGGECRGALKSVQDLNSTTYR